MGGDVGVARYEPALLPPSPTIRVLKVDIGLAGEDWQRAVTDESLCPVTGCALGTDVCHWIFKTKVNMVQGQEDGPLSYSNCQRSIHSSSPAW